MSRLSRGRSCVYDLDGRLTSDGLSSSYAYTPTNRFEAALTQAGALTMYRCDADGRRALKIAGGGASTISVVNGLSELGTEGGPITWTVDYVYAGRKLLAAMRLYRRPRFGIGACRVGRRREQGLRSRPSPRAGKATSACLDFPGAARAVDPARIAQARRRDPEIEAPRGSLPGLRSGPRATRPTRQATRNRGLSFSGWDAPHADRCEVGFWKRERPAGESGAPATSSAVESAELEAAVVTMSMDTATTLQVVEYDHLDAIGSVRAVTDADGNVIARHDFLPFGEELAPQTPPADERLFTGQVRDFGTGLDYFHARQLRADLGRFTTPDPLTDLAWTDPTLGASNAYGYVGANPLGFTDPMGMQDKPLENLQHPSYWSKDDYMVWGPNGYTCANCFGLVTQVTAPGIQWSSVTQPQTPMGAGVLGFFPGRGPVAPTTWGPAFDRPAQPQSTEHPEGPNCGPLADNLHGTGFDNVDTWVDAHTRIDRPLQAMVAFGGTLAAAAGQLVAGGLLVIGGCLEPTPLEPFTCVVSGIGAGQMLIGSAAAVYGGYLAVKHLALPAVKEKGCR